MKTIEYLKLQAKNLYKDFRTQKISDSSFGVKLFEYAPSFFDVDALVTDFNIDENNFTLMTAQHIIAKLAGFTKWTEMLKASNFSLELAKLLFDNMHKISTEEWESYVFVLENENNVVFDDETKLDIFKTVFANVEGHMSNGFDYHLNKRDDPSIENTKSKLMDRRSTSIVLSLPLVGEERLEFIEVANQVFKNILLRIEPRYCELVRNLWNAEQYIDDVLKPDLSPIDREYALSLIEAFLVQYIIRLVPDTDMHYLSPN